MRRGHHVGFSQAVIVAGAPGFIDADISYGVDVGRGAGKGMRLGICWRVDGENRLIRG